MSAPRRPGDSRAGRRPDRSGTRDDATPRRARPEPAKDEAAKNEPIAKPARKARAEGWAKAKPPRDKPGRASKFAGRFKGGKSADRPTPMREDGPRRDDRDTFAAPRDTPARDAAVPREARFGTPSFGRSARNRSGDGAKPAADRPKRSFGDNARHQAAAAPKGAREDGDARRAARGADRHAKPAGASTLRPAFGSPHPVREDAARPARPQRAIDSARDDRDAPRFVRGKSEKAATVLPRRREPSAAGASLETLGSRLHGSTVRSASGGSATSGGDGARPSVGKAPTSGKQPNRAARRAELREVVAPAPPIAATPAQAAPDPFLPGAGKREPQRIAKLLARAGVASRREIERMIEERRIAIDGVALETPATILTSLHGVTVDGQPVQAPTAARLFLFHKPPGVLTAERDFSGRPTIYDRLPEDLPRVMPVGRLDLNTEGLLLLTNDGEFKRKLELPSTGIPRVYRARAYGDVTQQMLEDLSEGVEIEGIRYGPIDANLERRTGANVWIEMRITEGKNREVRRVLEYLGLQVSRLIRVSYGEFVLADLASGGIVEVRQNDLVAFRQTLR